ncbi:hypothetical protein LOY55_10600 [Pseudomonas sp. B21-040]|uniref:hypothetical protein n=1 Tax=unclassified Pseudomonas TaxID=196821 RepID=UPI001CC0EC67|nr:MULTISPECIES: hypothetical protein [unclassified Pseudomonas]UVL42515.1 hypothetical protein LOY55_10600 [Pseudomonas sp. B21-040]
MEIEKLKILLKPWLREDTWHTGRFFDNQRFYFALKAAFEELGVRISTDHFRQAIILCLDECGLSEVEAFENDVEEFAQRGANVANYLFALKFN